MPRPITARIKLIEAAIFILMEVAAVAMLKSSATLQDVWINRASHRIMGLLWGGAETVRSHFDLAKQNKLLAEENFELRSELQNYKDYAEFLRENNASESRKGNFIFIPATVVKASRNTSHNYIILNKGSEDGVKPYSGIITSKGVIGIIKAVDKHYSYGLTMMNNNISVSCRVGADGIVASLAWDGLHNDKSILKNIPPQKVIEKNDTVFTSGFSSIFPKDIPIGVTGETKPFDGATNQVEVDLFQNFSSLRYVTIVENPEREEILNLEEKSDVEE